MQRATKYFTALAELKVVSAERWLDGELSEVDEGSTCGKEKHVYNKSISLRPLSCKYVNDIQMQRATKYCTVFTAELKVVFAERRLDGELCELDEGPTCGKERHVYCTINSTPFVRSPANTRTNNIQSNAQSNSFAQRGVVNKPGPRDVCLTHGPVPLASTLHVQVYQFSHQFSLQHHYPWVQLQQEKQRWGSTNPLPTVLSSA
tara:strand:+ start:1596 stop:2207 length:612 start_codon:yes stop_codon:yes gene_type:complete